MSNSPKERRYPDAQQLEESRVLYRRYCQADNNAVPLFSQSWLLDAIAPNRWGAAIARNASSVSGSLVYMAERRAGLWISTMPKLVPWMGPWLVTSSPSPKNRLSQELALLGELAQDIPDFDHFSQCWYPEVGNWLPFYWQGYGQTTKYTYRVEAQDPKTLWSSMSGGARTEVRKARNRHRLKVVSDCDLPTFLDLNDQVFQRQGLAVPYGRTQVGNLYGACRENANAALLMAVDDSDRPHAGCLIVWDDVRAYYLLGGSDTALRSSGGGYLVLWKALEQFPGMGIEFDFEGSMIRSIERVFRAMGGRPQAYHAVSATKSRLARTALTLRRVAQSSFLTRLRRHRP